MHRVSSMYQIATDHNTFVPAGPLGDARDDPYGVHPEHKSLAAKLANKAAMCLGSSCTPKRVRPIVYTYEGMVNHKALTSIKSPERLFRRPDKSSRPVHSQSLASTSAAGPSASRPASKKPAIIAPKPGNLRIHDGPRSATQAKARPSVAATGKAVAGKGKAVASPPSSPSSSSWSSSPSSPASLHGSPRVRFHRRRVVTR